MGKGSAPSAPDPAKTAAAQQQANVETARVQNAMNRANQYTPYGSVIYNDLGNDRWEAITSLSPNQQYISDMGELGKMQYGYLANQMWPQTGKIMQSKLDFSGLPGINDGVKDRARVEDALFARMQPRLDAQRNALDTRLRNQGLTPGSEAWTKAWQEYSMGENDARLATIGAAGQEQQRLFNMSTADRARALQEYLAQRQIPLNEVAALLGGAQVSYPQFVGMSQTGVNPTDVTGAVRDAYNAQMAAYNAEQQQLSGLYSGLGTIGAAAIKMSDIRTKENIKRVGTADNGLPLYLFNYIGDPTPHVSVMAQDVEKRDPGAVHEISGIKYVNLHRALEAE